MIRMGRIVTSTLLLASSAAAQTPIALRPDSPDLAPAIENVRIGTQVWMRENYAGTTFRNGDPIALATEDAAWVAAGQSGVPAYTTYANQVPPPAKWGLLYNFAAITDERGICPEGWRVPDNRDWRTLEDFLGGGAQAAKALKAAEGWPGRYAGSDSTGFGALPAGWRTQKGTFFLAGRIGYFWTRDRSADGTVLSHMVFDVERPIFRIGYDPGMGQSLRCIAE
ncbi:fibrobacter succinogenes major paralogous domain-containing protein [Sphingomonas sp. FW199]|uniref:fibrobacter succinogenes major paralogous domain-containing protein n=1 Tax=Sphingomonas sp. FW199 TaxID=3400217 RepID=UPI003CEF6B45